MSDLPYHPNCRCGDHPTEPVDVWAKIDDALGPQFVEIIAFTARVQLGQRVEIVDRAPIPHCESGIYGLRSAAFPKSWRGREVTAVVTRQDGAIDCVTWILAADLGKMVKGSAT